VKRATLIALLVALALGLTACGTAGSVEGTTVSPTSAPSVEAEQGCSDAEFAAAIAPRTTELEDAVASIAAAADSFDAGTLTEAGSRMVTAGAKLEGAARETPPCSSRLKEASLLTQAAGGSAVYAGLELQEASDHVSRGSLDAARRVVGQYRADMAEMSRKLEEATRLITTRAEAVPTSPEAPVAETDATIPGWEDEATESDWGFQTPSRNIFCNSGPDGTNELSCVVDSEGQSVWTLRSVGMPTKARMEGNIGTEVATLSYGRTWSRGTLSCVSRSTGLTCQNQVGHGFELSRERQRMF
jgi:Family of unknown function (DUF6636)